MIEGENQKMKEKIREFEVYLKREEKSEATIEKYLRDVSGFFSFLGGQELNKEKTVAYKEYAAERYAPASVNSMLIALNRFLRFAGRSDCCVRLLKIQRKIFCDPEKELSSREYKRLIQTAAHTRIFYIMQTICSTGIRVSELQYITAEAVQTGKTSVNCKNKTRVIFIPGSLQKLLKKYMKKAGIKRGPVFVTKGGKPLNRSNIWRDMKGLCKKAAVSPKKVFPHNLRHLFARLFYSIDKDIVRLADLMGHSSINTTRIYTMENGTHHRLTLEKMQKILAT